MGRDSQSVRRPWPLAVIVALCAAFLTASAARAQVKEASRVRILVVADTDAPGAAIFGLGLDGQSVKRVFDELFQRSDRGNRYTLDLYTGGQVSAQNILNYYVNLKSNPTETLVFYYTGHGIADKNQGHLITTHKGFLSRKVLLDAMQKHQPLLSVVLTDCCANYGPPIPQFGGGFKLGPAASEPPSPIRLLTRQLPQTHPSADDNRTRPQGEAAPEPKPTSTPAASDLLGSLFLRHTGLVDINASEMGKSASGKANLGGSYFTVALTRGLRKSAKDFEAADGFVAWRDFFRHLDAGTLAASKKGGFVQRPQAFSLGQPLH